MLDHLEAYEILNEEAFRESASMYGVVQVVAERLAPGRWWRLRAMHTGAPVYLSGDERGTYCRQFVALGDAWDTACRLARETGAVPHMNISDVTAPRAAPAPWQIRPGDAEWPV